ncbi:M3 family metallopeptidase [Streptomyces sp. NPDC026673]|uniref:M3 family metallopeptidase n=1 Tax=Streptomyces sp. NPDC026673 TaxID=3155724 RepID=UPI0033FCA138
MNPGLPDYSSLTPAALDEACQGAIDACQAGLAAIVSVPADQRTYANTLLALEEAQQPVALASGAWALMADVAVDEDLRESAREWKERLGRYTVGLGFDEELYRAVREFADTPEAATLSGEEARLLEHTLRDYRRNGFELAAGDRRRLRLLFEELVELESRFMQAIADWQDGIEVGREELDGLPDSFIEGLQRDGDRYRVSLDYPEYNPFMANARSSQLRRELMERNQRTGGQENVARLERAIEVRTEIAHTLGYDSWADYVIEPRMAGNHQTAQAFLDDLRAKVAVKAVQDLVLLADANEAALGTREIELWDHSFAANQLKRTSFAVDDLEVAAYFPLQACLDGLFELMQEVLAVRFAEVADAPVWHPDVQVYDITEADGDEPFARFYMDLWPRQGKYKHAAAYVLRTGRALADGSYQQPLAAIVANFTKPAAGQPSLLRHVEVCNLFHEFGHVLHDTLTRTQRARFAGTATELDFVEAPSQMLEHWCWDPAVLRRFARHHATGAPLPEELLAGMVAARNTGSGLATLMQVFFASLDLAYHSPDFDGDTTTTLRKICDLHGLTHLEGTHRQSSFEHLFGYEAGYYGYLWSRALADDMYTRFQAAGPLDPELGLTYRRTVLERGGSVDGARLVSDFLGRSPDHRAFLRNLGLVADPDPLLKA